VPDPLIGRRLGKYLIQQEIGRGGMARVYRATDTVLQRPVALKVLAPSLSADPEFARRFEREAITAANLRHPAIVTIFDVGEADGLHYIAMEYIAGRTLNEVLQERGSLGIPLTIPIIAPVAEALDFAHNNGMVHRDVKPHNIMLDTDGRVLLTDFGIAIDPSESTERLTRTGMFMGTPEYISPEQAQAQPLSGQSDLYSLGIVTYEMLAGRVPFEGGTAQQIMAHVYHEPPPLTSLDPASPPELDQLFARILAKDPQQRFDRAGSLVEALRYVARRYGMAIVSRDDVAALAVPQGSSAGQATVAMRTPSGSPTAGTASQAPRTPPTPFPIPDVFNSRPASGRQRPTPQNQSQYPPTPPSAMGSTARAGSSTPSTGTRNVVAGGTRQGSGRSYGYAGGDDFVPPPRIPRRRGYADDGGSNVPWTVLTLGGLAVVAIILIILLARDNGEGDTSGATPGTDPLTSAFRSTATPTVLPTLTLQPTAVLPTQELVSPPPEVLPSPTPEVLPSPTSEIVPTPAPEAPSTPTTEPTVEPTPTTESTPTVTVTPLLTPTLTATAAATTLPTSTPLTLPSPTPPPPGAPTPVGGGGTISYYEAGTLNLRDVATPGAAEAFPYNFDPIGPAAVSPDRSTILLDVVDQAGGARQIVALNRSNGRLTQLTKGQNDNFHPSWRPDGKAIVFASTRDGNAEIYTMTPDGKQQQRLTIGSGDNQYPSFSPDGTRIVFESTRDDGTWALFVMDAQGGPVTRLSPLGQPANDRAPRWSPDGKAVVFVSDRDRPDGSYEVYAQQLESGEVRRITNFATGSTGGPTWSPDGKLIAFFGNRSGNYDLYIVDLDQDTLLPAPASPADERWPSWSK